MIRLTVKELVDAAASITEHSRDEIVGGHRLQSLVRIRQAVYYLARREGYAYGQIGARLNRDHSTIMHGCKVTARMMSEDPYYTDTVLDILEAARVRRAKRHATLAAPMLPEMAA